jgi:hypothetical protein
MKVTAVDKLAGPARKSARNIERVVKKKHHGVGPEVVTAVEKAAGPVKPSYVDDTAPLKGGKVDRCQAFFCPKKCLLSYRREALWKYAMGK